MKTAPLIEQAVDYLKTLPKPSPKPAKTPHVFTKENVDIVAGLNLPKGDGAKQVEHIVSLLDEYAEDNSEKKPLSIAIFGPPGSGKSTFVKNISKEVKGIQLAKTANLTQVTDSEELADACRNALISTRGTADIPVIFFDEFDTMRDGTQLGWLSWFLAPMEDGVMLVRGQEVNIGKAIFIFAGGTAETLDEFSQRTKLDPEAYKARKVPDFVSRLRGAIDIGGVNGHGEERIVRRTLALSYNLDAKKAKKLGDKRMRQIMENGFFVHGARSVKTFLKAELSGGKASDLPEVIRRQHFSRGEFDGLTVGVSAGLEKDGTQGMSVALTERLLQCGASVAYAGAFFEGGTLDAIRTKAEQAPLDLVTDPSDPARVVNYLGYPASLKAERTRGTVFETRKLDTISKEELGKIGVTKKGFFEAIPDDPKDYKPEDHVAWAISQFRLRVRVMQDIGALVVFGGKDDGNSWGRMSGIAEEVMIALALRKPVYVLGGANGAAAAVGKLLGLYDAPVAINLCLAPPPNDTRDAIFKPYMDEFNIPGVSESPKDLDAVRNFLFNQGVNTESWPWNGLSVEENRELFACDFSNRADRAVALILQGLGRVRWKEERG